MTHDIRKFMKLMEQVNGTLNELDLKPSLDPSEPSFALDRDENGRAKHDGITMTQDKTKVTATLTSYKSQSYTKLAQKVIKVKELTAEVKRLEEEVKQEARDAIEGTADMAGLFAASDVVYTRVVETVSLVMTLSKTPAPTVTHKWAEIVKELEEDLTPDLIAKLNLLKKKYESTVQKSASLTIVQKESITEGIFSKFKDFFVRFFDAISAWGKSYDTRLDSLKDMAASANLLTVSESGDEEVMAEDDDEMSSGDEVDESVDYSRIDRIEKQVEYMVRQGRSRAYIIANIGDKMGPEEADYAGDYYDEFHKDAVSTDADEEMKAESTNQSSLYGHQYVKEDDEEGDMDGGDEGAEEGDEVTEDDLESPEGEMMSEFKASMGEPMAYANGSTVYCGARSGVIVGTVPGKSDTWLVELPNGEHDAFPKSLTTIEKPSFFKKAFHAIVGESTKGN